MGEMEVTMDSGTVCEAEGQASDGAAVVRRFRPLGSPEVMSCVRSRIKRYSCQQIAEETGFHRETVRRYLRDQGKVPAGFVSAVCAWMGVDPADVMIARVDEGNERRGSDEHSLGMLLCLRPAVWDSVAGMDEGEGPRILGGAGPGGGDEAKWPVEFRLPSSDRFSRQLTNDEIAGRIRAMTRGIRHSTIARATGFNHETVRRYRLGVSTIPAEFVGRLCIEMLVAPGLLLMGTNAPDEMKSLEVDVRVLAKRAALRMVPAISAWLAVSGVPGVGPGAERAALA